MTSPPKPRQVFLSLQAGRAIAAIMVVFFHCADILSRPAYWNDHSWNKFFNFGHSGVEVFFVLSGIVILHAHWNDLGRASQLPSYVWKRLRRIYPIYWLVLMLVVPLYLMNRSLGGGWETNPYVILESFLLIHIHHAHTVLIVAWSLYHEIMFYAVFAFMFINRRLGIVLITLWMIASGIALSSTSSNLFVVEYLSPLHLLFGMGMVMLLLVRKDHLPGMPLLLSGLAIFSACAVFDDLHPAGVSFLPVVYGVGSALALGGLMILEQRGRISVPDSLKFLGDASYSIYLIHFPLLSILTRLLYRLSRHHPIPLIVPFAIMAAVSVAAGSAVHQWIERPLLRIMSPAKKLPREVTV